MPRVFKNDRIGGATWFHAFGDDSHGTVTLSGPTNSYLPRDPDGQSRTDGKVDRPSRLFSSNHRPPGIHYMTSTSPTHVGPLLGMAIQEAHQRWGEQQIEPSHDLSKHSRPLVSKLQDRGLVPSTYKLPPTQDINFMGKRDAKNGETEAREDLRLGRLGTEQPAGAYRQGGQTFRSALREPSPAATGQQFSQPTLF